MGAVVIPAANDFARIELKYNLSRFQLQPVQLTALTDSSLLKAHFSRLEAT